MYKKVSSDAIISPFLKKVKIDSNNHSLKERFYREYRDRIRALWEQFLEEEALREVLKAYPVLLTPIANTNLSTRAKNCLRAAGAETIADVACYSLPELRTFRNTGAQTLQEVEELLQEVLV